jgi:hypothetical protein
VSDVIDIGTSAYKYKDLYLSGTAYVDTAVEIHAGNSLKLQNVAGNGFATIQNAGAGTNTDLSFNTAGSEAMRIDSSGNVGIGNTTSGYVFTSDETRLTVGDGAEHAAIQLYSGTGKWGGLDFADDTANGVGQGFIGYYHPSDYMQFNTSGTERMRIDSSGKVLISSTGGGTPGAQLQVSYNDSSTSHSAQGQTPNGLRMYNANTGTNVLTSISFAAPNAGTALASINMVNLNSQSASTTCLGDLTFSTKASGSSIQTERMRIKSTGDIEMNTPNSGVGLYINNTTHDSIVQIQASGANKNSTIRFADGDDSDVGMIDYDHNDNTMDITTNALTNGLEISSTKGRYSWKTFENWGTSNYNMTMAPGVVFQRKGTLADDIKIRVFQGSYTYTGGSIEFLIRKGGGTQTSVGSGIIYFNGRESEDNHVIVGYNESDQIVVNSDTYAGTYADGKFTFAIRSTSGDSHITIMNRLGSEVNLALKFNILYTG